MKQKEPLISHLCLASTLLRLSHCRWEANYLRLVKQREACGGEPGISEPEYRLPPAIAGAPLVTFGLFWFGWTT